MSNKDNNEETLQGLQDLVRNYTSKSEKESLDVVSKFSAQIQNKLSKNLSDISEIFTSLDDVTHSQPIYLSNIPFISLCEHHLLPFFGSFDLAVFPTIKIAGISKFSDLINH